jgi:hypothetical protein
MNQPGPTPQEFEQPLPEDQIQGEIPAYPGATGEEYTPEQVTETTEATVSAQPEYKPIPQLVPETRLQSKESVNLYNSPEQVTIPQSRTPELQTNIAPETSRSGERIFVNPELGQATFAGGVTSQQLVSKVAGYYTVQQGLISDPKSGLLQQSAATGDPASATTWQATILYKILQAFWGILGISS